MKSARCVITDSESSRNDIQRIYHLPEKKLFSIPLGLSQGFGQTPDGTREELQQRARSELRNRYGIDKPFILALGVLQPRKNLEMLAAAYGKLKAQFGVPHLLVLVGKAGWITAREAIQNLAARAGGESVRSEVLFPGYVPDDELPFWYRACSVFAHPSLYEGFGIPPLEAMSCGAPVLVSDAPALPELVGEAAAIAPASDPAEWAIMLDRIITDATFSNELAAKGPIRAAEFSWSRTTRQTIDVYRAAVKKP
jgi:glycosyltransferase involved in cell wall biosynthesis